MLFRKSLILSFSTILSVTITTTSAKQILNIPNCAKSCYQEILLPSSCAKLSTSCICSQMIKYAPEISTELESCISSKCDTKDYEENRKVVGRTCGLIPQKDLGLKKQDLKRYRNRKFEKRANDGFWTPEGSPTTDLPEDNEINEISAATTSEATDLSAAEVTATPTSTPIWETESIATPEVTTLTTPSIPSSTLTEASSTQPTPTSLSTSIVTSSSIATPSSSATISNAEASSVPTGMLPGEKSSPGGAPIGAIVGAVAGGLLAVIGGIVLGLVCSRHREKPQKGLPLIPDMPDAPDNLDYTYDSLEEMRESIIHEPRYSWLAPRSPGHFNV